MGTKAIKKKNKLEAETSTSENKSETESSTLRVFHPSHEKKVRKVFPVRENGVCYQLTDMNDVMSLAYKIDGAVIPEGSNGERKCDYLMLVQALDTLWVQIFIELKAQDVEHGLTQIRDTLQHEYFKTCPKLEKRCVRLVISSYPKSTNRTKEQKLIDDIRKFSGCSFRRMSNGQTETFEKLCKALGI